MSVTKSSKSNKLCFSEEIESSIEPLPKQKDMTKKKVGRPSWGKCKKITISVPIELLEGLNSASELLYRGNKSQYINSLIKKDQENNLDKYREFLRIKNN